MGGPPDQPSDQMHVLLARRGSAILPEARGEDGRVTLTDAMLVIAALGASFAIARASIGLGLAALALVLPALARTHVAMVRLRGAGAGSGVGDWLLAFVSSMFRVGLILGLVSVIHAASLVVGSAMGGRLFRGDTVLGAFVGFLALGTPLTLMALAYLVPRLLPVRDP